MKTLYPAIFTTSEDGFYLVSFPDVPGCFTDGKTLEEAFSNAADVVNLMLWDLEETKAVIPPASDPAKLALPENSFVTLIPVDTLEYRKKHDNRSVKKTLTIPAWLNAAAISHNINFSQILQNALIKELRLPSSK